MENTNDYIVKEDMICPVDGAHCNDECCSVGSTCNVSGNSNLLRDMGHYRDLYNKASTQILSLLKDEDPNPSSSISEETQK